MIQLKKIYLICLVLVSLLTPIKGKSVSVFSVTDYYRLINRAELSVCEGHLQNAYQYYNEAWSMAGRYMGSKNLYNYFMVCADMQYYADAGPVLAELKSRGWEDSDYLRTMRTYYNAPVVDQLSALYYEQGVNTKCKDVVYEKRIDSITSLDKTCNLSFRSQNGGLLTGEGADSMHRLTRGNMQYLRYLFNKQFPDDRIISRQGSVPYSFLLYDAILRHNAQGYKDHMLDTVLYKGVLCGAFDPNDFEVHMNMYHEMNGGDSAIVMYNETNLNKLLFPYDILEINDSIFQFPVAPARVRESEDNRKHIVGIPTLEELKTKIIYQYYHPKYHFVSAYYVNKGDFPLSDNARRRLIYLKDPSL